MKRLAVALLVALLAAPLAGEAQPARAVPVVGVLHDRPAGPSTSIRTMQEELSKLGYVEGQTVTFEVRYAGGKPEALQTLARELVQRTVDVIFAIGPAALRAARDATATIPIVTINLETDPVAAGYAGSVARPGGNVTGLFLNQPGLASKWLQLIKEAIPGIRRVALLHDRTSGPWQLDAARATGQQLGMDLQVLNVEYATDFDEVLRTTTKAGARALVQLTSPMIELYARRIAELTLKQRLPAISPYRSFTRGGGLMSYGPDQTEWYRPAASYIARILKGARPGDLPIEEPAKFELVINLKTAKALGLTIPPSLLTRADEVMQ